MNLKKLTATGIFCLLSAHLFATGQTPEIIIISRDTLPLLSTPMDGLAPPRRSLFLRRIHEANTISSTDSPTVLIILTSLSRGYVATWELRNDTLLFRAAVNASGEPADLRGICCEGEPATWFSGPLRVGHGKGTPADTGFPAYETETVYMLHEGVVTQRQERQSGSEPFDSPFGQFGF